MWLLFAPAACVPPPPLSSSLLGALQTQEANGETKFKLGDFGEAYFPTIPELIAYYQKKPYTRSEATGTLMYLKFFEVKGPGLPPSPSTLSSSPPLGSALPHTTARASVPGAWGNMGEYTALDLARDARRRCGTLFNHGLAYSPALRCRHCRSE